MKIALVILAKRLTDELKSCVRYHKPFFDEIVIVGSVDFEIEGCKTFKEFYGKKSFATLRNYAVSKTEADWILMVDTDEVFSFKFLSTIKAYLEELPTHIVGVKFKRINYFTNSYDYCVRLYKKNKCHWNGDIDEVLLHKKQPVDQNPTLYTTVNDTPILHIREAKRNWKRPTVLILTLVRNQEKFLPKFLSMLREQDYPEVHYSFFEGNSVDKSYEILQKFKRHVGSMYLRKVDVMFESLSRFEKLALLRNIHIWDSYKNEDYVLVIDSDLDEIPTNLISHLVAQHRDIIAPMVFFKDVAEKRFYDTLVFKENGCNFGHWYPYSPVRKSLPNYPFKVDSVGTCFMVSSDVIRECKWVGSDTMSEQIGFCNDAKEKGFNVVVDPTIEVFHANLGAEFH